jgi:hypothetical protein
MDLYVLARLLVRNFTQLSLSKIPKHSASGQVERDGGGKRREAGEPFLPGFTSAIARVRGQP